MTRQILTDSFRVKMTLNESKEDGILRVRGQFGRAGVPTANGRIYPYHLWEREIKKFHERIKDSKTNGLGEADHPCLLSDDFRVLTLDGWKNFKDIKPGDKVWSRVDGRAVPSVVKNIIDEHYKGIAYQFNGKLDNLGFTSGHKHLLMDGNGSEIILTTSELFSQRDSLSGSLALFGDNDFKYVFGSDFELQEVNHDGNIFCIETDHGNFYMEQNGHAFWTGNSDGKTKLQRASHIVTDLILHEDGTIEGELEVLEETEKGKIVASIIRRCGEIGVSSRGLGSVKKNHEGNDVVQEDFGFMTFDCVADPAVSGSFPKVQYESNELDAEKSLQEDDSTKVKHRIYSREDKFLLCIENRYCGMFDTKEAAEEAATSKTMVESIMSKYKTEDTKEVYGNRAQTLKTMKQQADTLAQNNPQDAEKIKKGAEALGKDWGIDPEKVEVKEAEGEEAPVEDPQEEPKEPEDKTLEADEYIVPDKEDLDEVEKILIRKGFDISDMQERNQGVQFFFDPISETENYDEAKEEILALDLVAVMEPDSAYVTKRSGRKLNINLDDIEPKDSGDEEMSKPDEQPRESVSESLRQEAYAKAVEAVEPILRDKLVLEFEEAYQAKLADVLKESNELYQQVEALGQVSKELGFNLFLERNLSSHPDYKNIKQRLGNFKRMESLDDLKETVKFKLEEAKEFQRTRIVNERKKTAVLESRIMKLEDKLASLEEENKNMQAELMESHQELKKKENRLYLESRLMGHPRASEIRKLYESTGYMEQSGINQLVESYRPVIQKEEKTLFESVQNAVKRRFPDNLVESATQGTRLSDAKPTEGNEKVYGVDFKEIIKLSGV